TLFGTSLDSDILFRLERDGSGYQVVYSSFLTPTTDTTEPSGIVEGRDGVFYGTADSGVLFKINRDGSNYSVLHALRESEGNSPAGLIQGRDGALYGTVRDGGSNAWG